MNREIITDAEFAATERWMENVLTLPPAQFLNGIATVESLKPPPPALPSPIKGKRRRKSGKISIRIPLNVISAFEVHASALGIGYQTAINEALKAEVKRWESRSDGF